MGKLFRYLERCIHHGSLQESSFEQSSLLSVPVLRHLQPLPLHWKESFDHWLELCQLCDQPPKMGRRHRCPCNCRLMGSPEAFSLYLWLPPRACCGFRPLPCPLQLLLEPPRLLRELKQGDQVHAGGEEDLRVGLQRGRAVKLATGFLQWINGH